MATETFMVRIVAKASEFSSTLSKMQGDMEKVSKEFEGLQKLGDGFKDIGKKMTVAGVAITGAVSGIVLQSAKWSASVESVDFLYKNLDKTVQQTIATNTKQANSLGLTERQYKAGATSLATYFKNMNVTAQESANLSAKTMSLVADLGAIADVPFDEAMSDFKSGLMGNYEALDKYGINLSAATLENSEYVKSLGKTWNKLSDNEKMMAAYNEITRQGATAQGLAKQEAGSFASQLKLLKENLADTFGEIGSTVLPYLEPFIQKVQEICTNIQNWVKEHPQLTANILLVVGAIGLLLATLGPILIAIGTAITTFIAWQAGMAALKVMAGLLGTTVFGLVSPILAVIGAIAGLIAIGVLLYNNWDEIKAFGKKVWSQITTDVKNEAQKCKEGAINIWNSICSNAGKIWGQITTDVKNEVQMLKDGVSNIVNSIRSTVSNIFSSISSTASSIWNSITSNISNAVNKAKSTVSSVINAIKSTVSSSFNSIKSTASSVWNGITSTISNAINKAKTTVSSVLSSIRSLLSGFKPSWSIPKPKLPKISVSVGSKSVGGISIPFPKFSVSWNAKGGIFRKPTIFNTANAGLQGVGEAGAEAILPLDRIQGYFDNAMRNTFGENRLGGDNINITVNAEVSNDIDIRTLANQIANHVERSRRW